MKNRFSGMDVTAMVGCLQQSCLGLRCANVYDVNAKTYLFKFQEPDHKEMVVVESGIRLHPTRYSRNKANVPSVFTMKLRRALRTKRLTAVRQLGVDRVFHLSFGGGDKLQHLVIEVYAKGNIVLCDGDGVIQACLRTHVYSEDHKVAPGQIYPLEMARPMPTVTLASVSAILGGDGADGNFVQRVLARALGVDPPLIVHACTLAGVDPKLRLQAAHVGHGLQPGQVEALAQQLADVVQQLRSLAEAEPASSANKNKGYIVLKADAAGEDTSKGKSDAEPAQQQQPSSGVVTGEEAAASKLYDAFTPLPLAQMQDRELLAFDSFSDAVDEYFSKVEAQKQAQAEQTRESTILKKVDKVRRDLDERMVRLQAGVDEAQRCADLIMSNVDLVEQACRIIQSGIDASLDWDELGRIVKREQRAGNEVAGAIHALHLAKGEMTLLLSDPPADDDGDEDDETGASLHTQPATRVRVSVAASAYANASLWFDKKKEAERKMAKTAEVSDQALQAAERRAQKAVKQIKVRTDIAAVRRTYWFEKFHWFLSSDGYVVVAGRDAQQNEMLVKRYLGKQDVYVHADLHGAATTIVKNVVGANADAIPPTTLAQAGDYCVARSGAWKAKVVTSAWWVYAHQVSKTAPSGEYLATGSFMIRGKKNFLAPATLQMGMSMLWKISDDSFARRKAEDDAAALAASKRGGRARTHQQPRVVPGEGEEAASGHAETEGARSGDGKADVDSSRHNDAPADEDATATAELEAAVEAVESGSEESEGEEEGDDDDDEDEDDSDFDSDDVLGDQFTIQIGGSAAGIVTAASEQEEGEEGKEEGGEDGEDGDDVPEVSTSVKDAGSTAGTGGVGASPSPTSGQQSRPKFVSKADRRRIKKLQGRGMSRTEAEDALWKEKQQQHATQATKPRPTPTEAAEPQEAATPSKGATKRPRGKSGKRKKMQTKYKHQDAEEREAMMAVLQSAGNTTEDDAKASSSQPEDLVSEEQRAASGFRKLAPEQTSDPKGGREGRKGRRARERAEVSSILEEERLEATQDLIRGQGAELQTLVPDPRPEDEVLYALAICAPYQALSGYKYRIKVMPGRSKRGKAAKTAVRLMMGHRACVGRELELLKHIPDAELHSVMMGDCTVSAPGIKKANGGGGGGGRGKRRKGGKKKKRR